MRTIFLTSFLVGCTTYPTLEEACNDSVPGGDQITLPVDKTVARWMNCHRRQAGAGQARVQPQLQRAVEPHMVYLETNTPYLNQDRQFAGNEPYTGATTLDRATKEGWSSVNGTQLLSLITIEAYGLAGVYVGEENFDLWFAYPVFRQAWLQNPSQGFGVVSGAYTVDFPEDGLLDDIPLSLTYWNILFQTPAVPYAQNPIKFPPNGATDVPARYVHLVDDDILEPFGEYGYPITFTVGSGESNLQVQSAALVGPSGPVSIQVITQGDFQRFDNTVIVVPDDPLQVGSEYTCEIELSTDQGANRRAKTTFSVGSRTLPGVEFLQARSPGDTPMPLQLQSSWSDVVIDASHGPLEAR